MSIRYPQFINDQVAKISHLFNNGSHTFSTFNYRHLLADRDIKSELASTELKLSSDGTGATNIIYRFITSSYEKYPRELVQVELLHALNRIFAEDAKFTEIQIQHHDEGFESHLADRWEIFLGEEYSGPRFLDSGLRW